MNEAAYRKYIDTYFDKDFNIDPEVWSVCGTKRIDYILECKESLRLFGIEVKSNEHLSGMKLGAYLNQASNYSKLEFKTKFCKHPVKVLIFITPAISNYIKEIIPGTKKVIENKEYYQTFHKVDDSHSNVNSFIGYFNVGEIRARGRDKYRYYYLSFRNQAVWDSMNGLRENTYNKITKQIF